MEGVRGEAWGVPFRPEDVVDEPRQDAGAAAQPRHSERGGLRGRQEKAVEQVREDYPRAGSPGEDVRRPLAGVHLRVLEGDPQRVPFRSPNVLSREIRLCQGRGDRLGQTLQTQGRRGQESPHAGAQYLSETILEMARGEQALGLQELAALLQGQANTGV